jgi:hypothetical protein
MANFKQDSKATPYRTRASRIFDEVRRNEAFAVGAEETKFHSSLLSTLLLLLLFYSPNYHLLLLILNTAALKNSKMTEMK